MLAVDKELIDAPAHIALSGAAELLKISGNTPPERLQGLFG
jgi:hypothetical protein